MTEDEFNGLPDEQRKQLLIDAKKIGEYEDEMATYQTFKIEDFFVEVSMSVTHRFRKIIRTYASIRLE